MNIARAIKLIKHADRKDDRVQIAVELAINPNRWSTTVRSWVGDFQARDRSELLPTFDSLFKDPPPSLSPGAKSASI